MLALQVSLAHAAGLCPPTLITTQAAVPVPAGLAAASKRASAPLMTLAFFDREMGPSAALEPDVVRRAGDMLVWTFTFPMGKMRANYLRCAYLGTQIELVKKLDPAISQCSVTYDRKQRISGQPLVRGVECN